VTSALLLAGVAVAAVTGGPEKPAVTPQTPARATSVFEPKRLTIVVRLGPGSVKWPDASETVRIRGSGTPGKATTHLSSGDGGQLKATLKEPEPNSATPETRQVSITDIEGPGEYTGVLSLDPTDQNAATLDLTVKARHNFWWPLLVIVVGAVVSWLGRKAFTRVQGTKPKRNNIKFFVYVPVLMFAAAAFLLPIYNGTNFGTWEQYLSLLAAGILGNVVVDKSLLQPDDPAEIID
jgi:hypothetical protein